MVLLLFSSSLFVAWFFFYCIGFSYLFYMICLSQWIQNRNKIIYPLPSLNLIFKSYFIEIIGYVIIVIVLQMCFRVNIRAILFCERGITLYRGWWNSFVSYYLTCIDLIYHLRNFYLIVYLTNLILLFFKTSKLTTTPLSSCLISKAGMKRTF